MSGHQRVILGMQEQLEKYGYTVVGVRIPLAAWGPGTIVHGIVVTPAGQVSEQREDISLCIVGPATIEEWKQHCLERGDNWDEAQHPWTYTAYRVVAE